MIETISFLLFGINSPALFALIGGIASGLYLCYRWALPRPIPGIPYNKEATKTILGDIVPMVSYVGKTKEFTQFFTLQKIRHRSPIVQVFASPFGKPFVIITDFRESQDILLRRNKEFGRSKLIIDVFSGVLPEHHIIMQTNDTFRQHRRWLHDLMTPDFLHQIAAPRIYTAFRDLLKLWGEKSRLAERHPFAPAEDVYRAALDAVWNVMFLADPSNSATRTQLLYCSSIVSLNLPSDVDKEAHIPHTSDPEIFHSVITLTESMGISGNSPVPRIAHRFLSQMPYMRKAYAVKEKFVKEEVERTLDKFVGKPANEWDPTCAMDDILRREMLLSEKEGRTPMFHSRGMYDEIFGFIVAAHETTSTTITWALKVLADHQDTQSKLRAKIRSEFSNADTENRAPTYQEIIKATIPYLDAVTEETIRYSRTGGVVIRNALVDVEVLGHHIPKGTDVFMMTQGPSIFSPAFPIDDSLRSPSALAAKDRVGSWNPDNMGEFEPERWLVEEDGKTVFNPAAGPMLAFGLGPRGCYGRRMAYLELRLLLVLLVWSFELLKCPEELSGYAGAEKFTHVPQQCYVRLSKL